MREVSSTDKDRKSHLGRSGQRQFGNRGLAVVYWATMDADRQLEGCSHSALRRIDANAAQPDLTFELTTDVLEPEESLQ